MATDRESPVVAALAQQPYAGPGYFFARQQSEEPVPYTGIPEYWYDSSCPQYYVARRHIYQPPEVVPLAFCFTTGQCVPCDNCPHICCQTVHFRTIKNHFYTGSKSGVPQGANPTALPQNAAAACDRQDPALAAGVKVIMECFIFESNNK